MHFFRIIFHFKINDQCFDRADLNFAKFNYFFLDFDFNFIQYFFLKLCFLIVLKNNDYLFMHPHFYQLLFHYR